MVLAAGAGAAAAVTARAYLPRTLPSGARWLALCTAVLAGVTALVANPDVDAVGFRVVLVVLAAAAVVDLHTLRLPNTLSFAATLAAVYAWVTTGAHLAPLLVAGSVGLIMLVAYLAGGAGGGDLKMLPPLVLAATAAQPLFPFTVLWASVLVGVVFTAAFCLHAVAGARRSQPTPLGPAMLLAGVGALLIMA